MFENLEAPWWRRRTGPEALPWDQLAYAPTLPQNPFHQAAVQTVPFPAHVTGGQQGRIHFRISGTMKSIRGLHSKDGDWARPGMSW